MKFAAYEKGLLHRVPFIIYSIYLHTNSVKFVFVDALCGLTLSK